MMIIQVVTKRTGTVIAVFNKKDIGKAIRYAGGRNALLQWGPPMENDPTVGN